MMRFVAVAILLASNIAFARPIVLCTLGDSLVAGGPILAGNPSWTQLLQTERVGGRFGVINAGLGGAIAAQAMSIFEDEYVGRGCTHLVVLVGTNNLASGDTAASIMATLEDIRDAAKADTSGLSTGMNVTICTVPPRGGSAGWDAGDETRRLALNALILAMTGVDAVVNLEPALGGTGDPLALSAAVDSGDHLHPNGTPVTGGQAVIADAIDAAVAW